MWHTLGRTGDSLFFRVTGRGQEPGSQNHRIGSPAIEPVFAGFKALNYRMAAEFEVCSSVPVERIVAAADMSAGRTASEM
jgi:hypothetical protein